MGARLSGCFGTNHLRLQESVENRRSSAQPTRRQTKEALVDLAIYQGFPWWRGDDHVQRSDVYVLGITPGKRVCPGHVSNLSVDSNSLALSSVRIDRPRAIASQN